LRSASCVGRAVGADGRAAGFSLGQAGSAREGLLISKKSPPFAAGSTGENK